MAEFAMEDVLEVYQRPYNPQRPVVCLDEATKQLVMDKRNTHKPASLYEAFEPAEARRILDRLEIHYTPKHGSWLGMAEIELDVLTKQCLDRRIPDQPTLIEEVPAWETSRPEHSLSALSFLLQGSAGE